MKFNEFLKDNFENLSSFFEQEDLVKFQNIYITDISLFKKIQKKLPQQNNLHKKKTSSSSNKPILKEKIQKSKEKKPKRKTIVRKKGMPLMKIKKKTLI